MSEQTNKKVSYLELISQDEEVVQEENLKLKAQEGLLDLSRKTIEVSQSIGVIKSKLDKAKRAIPYNVEEEYKLYLALTQLEDMYEYLQKVKEDRFFDALV